MADITSFELMSKEHFIQAFNRDKINFKDNGGEQADFDQFLKWAEVQKLERINAQLIELTDCFKKG